MSQEQKDFPSSSNILTPNYPRQEAKSPPTALLIAQLTKSDSKDRRYLEPTKTVAI